MPNRRSPEEIRRSFEMAKKMAERHKVKENELSVSYAKNALLALGIIQVLIYFYYYNTAPEMSFTIAIEIAIGAVFFGLYFYARKEPISAFIIGLSVYGGIILMMAVINPATIFSALFLKAIIIAILVTGLTAAKKLPKPKPPVADDLLDDDFD